jgi:hypothetical protein
MISSPIDHTNRLNENVQGSPRLLPSSMRRVRHSDPHQIRYLDTADTTDPLESGSTATHSRQAACIQSTATASLSHRPRSSLYAHAVVLYLSLSSLEALTHPGPSYLTLFPSFVLPQRDSFPHFCANIQEVRPYHEHSKDYLTSRYIVSFSRFQVTGLRPRRVVVSYKLVSPTSQFQ